MFYAVNGKKKVPITYINTYARCQKCGALHNINLFDLLYEMEVSLEDV